MTNLDQMIDRYVTMGPEDQPGYEEEEYRRKENKAIEYALKYLDQRIARLEQDLSDGCYLPEGSYYSNELERLIEDREEIREMLKYC